MKELLNALTHVITVIVTMLITGILGYHIPHDSISQIVVVLGSIVCSVLGYWFGYEIIDRIEPDAIVFQVSFAKRMVAFLISVALAILARTLYERVFLTTDPDTMIGLALLNSACIGCAIGNFIRNLWDVWDDTWVW